MMALIQHDLRRLLSFHAISQVGYMVLGFGTGTAIGVAGGIFHMLNHAIYKTGLFLSGGCVGKEKKTFALEKLGGLAAYMPITFLSALIFSLSISGIPPLNGFSSKWLIYQGIIAGLFNTFSQKLRLIYIFALVCAMFGSVLTLASFIKFIHAIFLGQASAGADNRRVSEVSWSMRIPLLVLTGLCFLLGIIPRVFLKNFIDPALPGKMFEIGDYNSLVVSGLILLGLVLGVLFWASQRKKKLRPDYFFIGGEDPVPTPSFPATDFYRTIQSMPGINKIYQVMEKESLDIYNIIYRSLILFSYLFFIFVDRIIYLLTGITGYIILGLSYILRRLHSGVLDFYLAWSLSGLIALLVILRNK